MFSRGTRQESIEKMQHEKLDLLIIGGGITGAGVALQAAASGIKTGLIEMQDFAEGTSSRSTKLVHGGIRYLKTFDVEVVADTVGERAVVQGIAPHIPNLIQCYYRSMKMRGQRRLICFQSKWQWISTINWQM